MKRYTSQTVIAMEFCLSNEDMNEYRYQYGRTDKPIYCIDDYYWCATREGNKPAKHRGIDYQWIKHPSNFAKSLGWQIWKCKA